MRNVTLFVILLVSIFTSCIALGERVALTRLGYNNAGLEVDLGVGLWAQPLPMDYDGDGDNDLLVVCSGVPYNGTYFFENMQGKTRYPVFKPAVRLADGPRNVMISYVNGGWELLSPENRYPDFRKSGFSKPVPIPYKETFYSHRADQWFFCDYDGDGVNDLIVGPDDWREYGWDNAFNVRGEWTHGPLRGHVYFMKNRGANDAPVYAEAQMVEAGGKPVDVFGTPSPNFADWDGDGDLDLVCGEFLDKVTYFENIGTRREPRYAVGRYLQRDGVPITMELEMLQVVAFDWDGDGDVDLVVGQEDGRVALWECTGKVVDGMPEFLPPRFFSQQADSLKVGALATPYSVDWDGDGDEDLVVGDTAGFLNFVENLDGGNPPKWAAPVHLQGGGETIRIQAGLNGSIQGPCEAKWGYTVPTVVDWDQDGRLDILINDIRGEVLWYRNTGEPGKPVLAAAQPVDVEWGGATPKPAWLWWNPKGKQLVTQWRTRPMAIDWNKDGLVDLVMLDTDGYLAFFERKKEDDRLVLLAPVRIFTDENGAELRLNSKQAGGSGRRQFIFTDWDQDGKVDILIDGRNMNFLRNVSTEAHPNAFKDMGEVDGLKLAGHTPCPAVVDWDKNGIPDLVIGAEDGFFYYMRNPVAK